MECRFQSVHVMVGVVERKATVVIVMDIAALIRLSSIFGNALYA